MSKFDVKKVFIAGGTGFLGFYSAKLFLEMGCSVDTIALPLESENLQAGDWFPSEIGTVYGNLFEMSEDQIYDMLKDHDYDTFVYGLGPDDRVTPKAPAYDFFHERLVVQCTKIVRAAKRAGIRRCVVMNSYFAYFDRLPENNGKLSRIHPYIRVRNEQAAECIALGEAGKFDVMIMEFPYIFGNMPGRVPLWKGVFLDRFAKMPAVFFPNGGTTMIHVKGIAESVVAAAFNGEHGGKYVIGNEDWKYKDMINTMMSSIGSKKRFCPVPVWMCALGGWYLNVAHRRKGEEGGLNYQKLMSTIQSKDFFLGEKVIKETREALGYAELADKYKQLTGKVGFNGGGDVKTGIEQTMRACYPEMYDEQGNLRV